MRTATFVIGVILLSAGCARSVVAEAMPIDDVRLPVNEVVRARIGAPGEQCKVEGERYSMSPARRTSSFVSLPGAPGR